MGERETQHTMVIRVTATELAKVHQLADNLHESIAVVVRRWIRDSYQMRFGDATPATPKLKHGGCVKLPR